MKQSQLFGVSIRSWNASVIIVAAVTTLAYLAITGNDQALSSLVNFGLAAVGFLFGKAAGSVETSLNKPLTD